MGIEQVSVDKGHILQIFGDIGELLTIDRAEDAFKAILDVADKYGLNREQIYGSNYHNEDNVVEPYLNIGFVSGTPVRKLHSLAEDINTSSCSSYKALVSVRLPVFRQTMPEKENPYENERLDTDEPLR